VSKTRRKKETRIHNDTPLLKSILVDLCLERIPRLSDGRRREAIAEKRRYGFSYGMIRCDGEGYEPPRGHLMPLSTHQPLRAMLNPLN